MSNRVIISIHGLLNKPEATLLEDWWRGAILEGLKRNRNYPGELPPFELAYWANVRNADPVPFDKLEETYFPAAGSGPFPRYDGKLLVSVREVGNKYGGAIIDKAKQFAGLGKSVELLLSLKLEDLSDYYQNTAVREAIRGTLEAKIEAHKNKEILLMGHSMGSIIAYDVLRTHDGDDNLRIKHFLTLGSPLGLPYVCTKVSEEFSNRTTPLCAEKWTNVADPRDKVALDCKLADDYKPNRKHVKLQDVYIDNEYRNKAGKANNHKSYGYLRAPEVTDILYDFISG